MLSDAALLEECQLIKALRRSKRETTIHQADGSSEEADFESEVPDEPKGNGDEANVQDDEEIQESDDEPQHADDEGTNFENQETNDDKEETEDEFVHTPPNYVPTDDETNDESNDVIEEEYERINEELYGDVNVRLTNAEPKDENKGHKEMTNAETEDDEHENVNQEGVGNQVKDDAHVTQKTEATTSTTAVLKSSTTVVSESKTLTVLQLRVRLIDVDNSTKVISTIQSEVPKAIKEYLGSSLDDAIHKVIQKNIAGIIKEHSVPAKTVERLRKQYAPQKKFDQKTTLFEKMTKSKGELAVSGGVKVLGVRRGGH
ncbi:hypothetical protein Tco_0595582, partial [Tanacetum coccineum]